ncbi:MAG: Acetylornithine deacetylase [Anaerolineae bacterium]|jgi:acetylornithine deacetylase/succinyl-diaminopimelate desuccinylase-like protein|nr:MAG: Acetylornithine deacetylase [Anaerolineae bacterium]
MSGNRNAALAYAQNNQARFLEELKTLIKIPSVSTEAQYEAQIKTAAGWVADHLRDLGIHQVAICPTERHPVVWGEYRCPDPHAPTLLVYGHYDVQPPDPLELWQSPPFEPTVSGDYLYGRGASDMKGQLLAGLKAIESVLRTDQLRVNLRFLIEGEEEIGSPSLEKFISENKDRLQADVALNLDSGILAPDFPTITISLRGLAYFELRVYGAASDLHSGIFGGVVHNPAQVLCELIAGMHDGQGRVTLPGFYERVRPLSEAERAEMARLPLDEAYYLKLTGAPALYGEEGYTPAERVGARPTLEVNGLYSGYIGEGSKTVLPAYAMAKISCRLVPDQDPAEVYQQLLAYLQTHAPRTVRWEVIQHAGSPAGMIEPNRPDVTALSRAMEQVWGKKPAFKREGGSIPIVAQLQQILGMPTILSGFGLPDDNLHAPNERLHLPTWQRGIETLIHFFYNLAG